MVISVLAGAVAANDGSTEQSFGNGESETETAHGLAMKWRERENTERKVDRETR